MLLIIFVFLLNKTKPTNNKNINYECGFKSFNFIYIAYDIQFYRIGILFLLFDIEILFFFPWFLNFYEISLFGHLIMFIIIILLGFGFFYEFSLNILN
jgi:NADH-quinone oxidoreductase subunit A